MRAIDGFREEYKDFPSVFDEERADRLFSAVNLLGAQLKVEVAGIDQLPKGRGLIVANHAFGWDVLFAMAAVWRDLRRPLWVLGEHLWWKVPFLRWLAASAGTVDGTPDNVDRLLQRDELVLVLPGGLREAVKPRELRYQFLWGQRYGFIRAALRNQAPVVPLASIGTDELFDFVGDAYSRGSRWLRRGGIPIPLPARILPIPRLVRMRFVFGEPIAPRGEAASVHEFPLVRAMRREVEGALHELIELELARRLGVDLG
ncbi:MAG: lysophospholipid acyltransferase family protein [Myxococcales bacterium]